MVLEKIDRLLRQVMNGDRQAQWLLYEQYRGRWFLVCLRYNQNREDAQDCLQNALVKIYTHLDQFDPRKGDFTAWSTRIVINENLQFLKSKRNNVFVEEWEFSEVEDEQNDFDDSLSLEQINQLLQKLPLGYRTVFNLYTIEGYNHHEIAEILEISAGTSKSQLSRARNMLKRQIELHLNSV